MNELLALVVELQERVAWKLPFIELADCLRYQREASEYRDGPDFADHARHLGKTAEECRRRAIELGDGKLVALMSGLRLHAPELLPLVPVVDFFGPEPADLAPLVQAMRQIEAGLRAKATSERAEKQPRRNIEFWLEKLCEFESELEDDPALTEAAFAHSLGEKPDTVRDGLDRARQARDAENRSKRPRR